MPRRPRDFSKTDIYHVILRGNDKCDIFYEDQDRYVFLDRVEETKKKFNYEIYTYCLMDNHVHMVIRVKDNFLSKSMQSLEVRYSSYFNKKFNRTGHLFQNRFFSKKVENLNYFLTVCKYIHRNPEKANMEKTENYKWSSYQEYVGKEKIIDKSVLLYYFGDNMEEFEKFTLINDDKEQIDLKNASDVSLLEKEKMKEVLKQLKNLQGTSLSQISRVTRITPYYIKKIWEE